MNMVISHNLQQDEVSKRLKAFIGEVKKRFTSINDLLNDQHKKCDNMCLFEFPLWGIVYGVFFPTSLTEERIFLNLPFWAVFFKKDIESAVRGKIETLLAQ